MAEVEYRSLDGGYCIRRLDKYDEVLEDEILCVSVANLYLMCHPIHSLSVLGYLCIKSIQGTTRNQL